MMFKEYVRIAFRNLRARSLRSWLTILGIVIGVFLVSGLLSLSEGLKESILRELRVMGGEIIIVMPGDITDFITALIGGLELSNADILAIESARGVAAVLQVNTKAELVRHTEAGRTMLISGVPLHESARILQDDLGWQTVEGRWPLAGRREVLVGNLVPKDLFPSLRAGDTVFVRGRPFEVAGVLRSVGNRQDDSMIILDLEAFRSITGMREGVQLAMVKIEPGADANVVAESIRFDLEETRKRRGDIDAPTFSVVTSDAASEMIGNIMAVLQLAVFGFASIAIAVGGIGIMNTMYTSVYERTGEIGILKAVGAKRRDIVAIFLIEAGMIGLAGGLAGIFFGFGSAKLVELYAQFHPVLYLEAIISLPLIIFSVAFAFLIGCAAGFLPARRAAKLNPVDALRYE